MIKRRLTRCGRRKAPFGSEEAAILGAAAINAATQIAVGAQNAKSIRDNAKDQAKEIARSTNEQVKAIKDQANKTREYQQESQEFIKEENAQSRELQKDLQMTLQMMAGQQTVNDRLEASKIQVRNGGSTKRKLKSGRNATFPLRGSYYSHNGNLPFKVPHNGKVEYVKSTPEGYDLYSIYGPNHNNGGVDIDFIDGAKIEAEGDKIRTGRNKRKLNLGGEYMLDTKNNAYFISQHDIAGVNPAELIDNGMHPLQAYAIQEQRKAANGISDDGKNDSSPVRKMMIGGNFINNLYNESIPQLANDTTGSTITGAAYVNNEKPKLRNGGKCRRKATNGLSLNNFSWLRAPISSTVKPTFNGSINPNELNLDSYSSPTNSNATRAGGGWGSPELWGSGATALANFGATWLVNDANNDAARMLSDANLKRSSVLAGAYRDVPLIDLNSIRREDYAAAHAMPVLQAPISFVASKLAPINRQLQRRLNNAGKYSASSAAAQDRMAEAEIDAQDQRNAAYSADQQQMQAIRQANAERITQAAIRNAELDTQANREFSDAYIKALMYNNEAESDAIFGAAGATAEGIMGSATAMAQARTANAQAWSSALLGSSQGFTNSLTNMANRKAELDYALLGANEDSQANYYANSDTVSNRQAYNQYQIYAQMAKDASDDKTKNMYRRRANAIAYARGFQLV